MQSFPRLGMCKAKIISSRMVQSDLYPGQARKAYTVEYLLDKNVQEFEEEELRPLLCTQDHPERKAIIDGLVEAFDYLEQRITGTCETSNYNCDHMYAVCKAARAFNPAYATNHLTPAEVDALVSAIRPLSHSINVHKLKAELPAYLVAARDDFNEPQTDDVQSFTDQVLTFWRRASKNMLSEWRKAAEIVFACSPNSASCERVFSLLKIMFGDQQSQVLADYLQAALMMRNNGRSVACS